jgi:hypothetical protein
MFKMRFFAWTMIAALLISLIPFAGPVQAAATFFIPDDTNISRTSSSVVDTNLVGTLNRGNVFVTTSKELTIDGSYQFVAKDTMSVKVEQLLFSQGAWNTDTNRTTTKGVTASSSNRFSVTALPLYAGYNRVTFTGIQGGINKTDTFYVLYDEVPYLSYLKVTSGSNPAANLNQGVSMVVDTEQIILEGKAINATAVSVNGFQASLLDDGTFFAPSIQLNPGTNTLNIVITNPANELKVTRTIYYFDDTKPYNKINIAHSTDITSPILNSVPILTAVTTPVPPAVSVTETASLNVEMIVPYSAQDFLTNASVQINATNIGVNTVNSTLVVPGSDGVTPAYKIVDFTTKPFDFQPGTVAGSYAQIQTVSLDVYYDTFRGIANSSFKYYPNDVVINNVSLITDSRAVPTTGDLVNIDSTYSTVPLDQSEIQKPDFYILVEANRAIEAGNTKDTGLAIDTDLTGKLLPIGITPLSIEYVGDYTDVSVTPNVVKSDKKVYKVTGFPSGTQALSFQYSGAVSDYKASLTYVSKNFISIDNLIDGQTIEIDSRILPTAGVDLPITGAYVGFDNLTAHELFLNGQLVTPFNLDASNKFNALQLQIGDSRSPLPLPSLSVGENRLVFTGTYTNGTSVSNISKEIRIYIVDKNVPVIERFQPSALPIGGRVAFQAMPMLDSVLSQIFFTSPDMQFVTDKYVTSMKTYDLSFKVGGVNSLVVKRGSDVILTLDPASIPITPTIITKAAVGTTPAYDLSGSKDNLVLRLNNLQFDAPGSHVYTLELTNSTGAKVNQRLEVERVLEPFRILSPIASVGDRVIVNKNFVHFDVEAEGATDVTINGVKATKRPDMNDRFIYDFIGLKPDKETTLKLVITRPGGKLNQSITVFYASSIQKDSEFMEKISNKHSIFDKNLELTFPKGTILQSANPANGVTQFYDKTNLLFGIADPSDGVVERRNDYGNILNRDIDARTDARVPLGQSVIRIPDILVQRYISEINRRNFSRVSPVYWISGGVGEEGVVGAANYKPATDGLTPYSVEGTFTLFPSTRKVVPTKRGELTLKYDNSVIEAVGTTVTVFFFNDKGEWVNLGGKVDAKNNTITVPFDDFGYYMVTKMKFGFPDVTNHPWARNVLEALFSKGLMPNLRFDTFGTDDLTTRGEFATMLVKSLNIPLNYDNNQTFFEIGPGARSLTWDYAHIETAARTGIVAGLDNRFFGADLKLTREQAATMIARALELKLAINDSKLSASLSKQYTDSSIFSYYSLPAIDAVTKAGVMVGKPNDLEAGQKKQTVRFDAIANLTRAEAGQIAVRLLQKYTKTFPTNLN